MSGTAEMAAGIGASQGMGCACDAGWGDMGCGTAVTPLSSGVQVAATVATGFWSYYELKVLSINATILYIRHRTKLSYRPLI